VNRKAAILLVVALAASILVVFPVQVKATSRTILVPADYSTIQEAIDNAVEGDTVYVKKGVYVENPVVNKSISLVGEDRDSTVIDVTAGLKVTANGVTVKGFTIYDGWQGISVGANCCSILGNKITNATNGIVVFGYENNITGNILFSIGLSSAIQLNFAYGNVVSKNYIESCVEGIQIWQGSNNNTIRENTITNCKDTAINFQYSNDNMIVGNNISSSGLGTSIYGSNRNTITKNNYRFNAVQFGANETYYLTFGNEPSVNNIDGNYWSDYTGADGDGDGIGDTPYTVNANHVDRYPLMKPVAGSVLPDDTNDVTVLPDGATNNGVDGAGYFPFLFVVAVAAMVAVVVAAVAAVVYLKKRRASGVGVVKNP
jgi:nitrous oxidase accessory protein